MRNKIVIIYLKELKEVLRDKRTLIFMLIMPTVLVPLLMHIVISFVVKSEKKAETEVLTFAFLGSENLPQLVNEFSNNKEFKQESITSLSDVESAIKYNKIKFALVIPENALEQIEKNKQITVQLYYNNASAASKIRNRVGDVIKKYSEEIRDKRLQVLGLDSFVKRDTMLYPVSIEEKGIAKIREVLGERTGGILPYMFIIFCMMGAMYPAIDLGAGEKERGTLETLLLAPIERYKIVLGKFFVIFTSGVISALLSLAGMGVMLVIEVKNIPPSLSIEFWNILSSISIVDLFLIGSMMIPTAAMFAALLLSISIYARSYKEASAYCGPLSFLVIIPAIIAVLPVVKLDWFWSMIPLTNISLAIKELIKGTMNYEMFIAILGSSFIIAAGLLFFSTKWFERESVLFRQ
jgi:sodium transport system permease protein